MLVVLGLTKLGAIAVKVTAKTVKLKVKAPKIRFAAEKIHSAAGTTGDILDLLIGIQALLSSNWAGDDYDAHRQEHQKLCDSVLDMQQCLAECSQYLKLCADEYENAQRQTKVYASQIPGVRR